IELRRDFIVEHYQEDFKQFMFEDETTVCLRHTGRLVWKPRGSPQPERKTKEWKAVANVVGAIWWNGSAFARYKGWMNSEKYLNFLRTHLSAHAHRWERKTLLH